MEPVDLREFGDCFYKKRVLVTGATGFIGFHLCTLLQKLNSNIFAAALDGNLGAEIHQIPFTRLDLREGEVLDKFLNEIQPEFVFHLASLVNTGQEIGLVLPTLHNNLVSSINLLISLTKIPIKKVIIVSSSEIPIQSKAPSSPYSASKVAEILYARMFGSLYELPVTIAKLFTCFGPFQRADKLIPHIIYSAINNVDPYISNPEKILDFIYVKDFVRGLLMAAKNDHLKGDTLDFGSSKGIQINLMAQNIQSMCDNETFLNQQMNYPKKDNHINLANIKSTYSKIGWRPTWSLEEALNETIAWYKDHGNS